MRIRSVNNPLARGKALLLVPDACLIRWPGNVAVPDVGAAYTYEGDRVFVTPEQAALVRRVLLAPDALDRCDAAAALQLEILVKVYSYQQANHMRHIAEHLCPELREHVTKLAKLGIRTSLHHLIVVSYGATGEEQLRRWNAHGKASEPRGEAQASRAAARSRAPSRAEVAGERVEAVGVNWDELMRRRSEGRRGPEERKE